MPLAPKEPRALEEIRVHAPAPIDDKWKDEFVESLLRELRRQLHQLENAPPAPHGDEASIRSHNVQTLARIERSLDRLIRMHENRYLKQGQTKGLSDDDARAALERRLDKLAAATTARPSSKGNDGG